MASLYPHVKIEHPVNRNGYEGPPSGMVLARLEALGAELGQTITLTSGFRSDAKQRDTCATGVRPCAAPGRSNHRYGLSGDAYIGSQPIGHAVSASTLRKHGLIPLAGDPPHVDLADAHGGLLVNSLSQSTKDALYRFFSTGAKGTASVGTKGGDGILSRILQGEGGAVAGAALGPAGIVTGGALGLAGKADDVAGSATNLAGDVAGAVVGLVFDALGKEGARILLYVALVGGGASIAYVGLARALGARVDPQALATVLATRNPRAGAAVAAAGGTT